MGTATGQKQRADYSETNIKVAAGSSDLDFIIRVIVQEALEHNRIVSSREVRDALDRMGVNTVPQHRGAAFHVLTLCGVLRRRTQTVKANSATNEHHNVYTYYCTVTDVKLAQQRAHSCIERHEAIWAKREKDRAIAARVNEERRLERWRNEPMSKREIEEALSA